MQNGSGSPFKDHPLRDTGCNDMFPVIDVTAKIMCIPLESESADGRVDMWVSGPARRWPQFV